MLLTWRRSGWASPAPAPVKQRVLARYGPPNAHWIESGTFRGDMTEFLEGLGESVVTIEPEPALVERALRRFRNSPRVRVLNGQSEDLLEGVLSDLAGLPIALWLDGHYSAGVTFRGAHDTPIRQELELVGSHLVRCPEASILVDDWRCFDPSEAGFEDYPHRSFLVDWAERHGLWWTVEHDIFVAVKRRSTSPCSQADASVVPPQS